MREAMETVLDASSRLRTAGFTTDLSAAPHGRLRCSACGAIVDAAGSTVVDIVRYEGESNPEDEAILIALIAACGHRGLFGCAYGQTISAENADVLRALPVPPLLTQVRVGERHRCQPE